MRTSFLLVMGLVFSSALMAQDRGLRLGSTGVGMDTAGPRWQARFDRVPLPLTQRADTPLWLLAGQGQTLRLLGDYELGTLRIGPTGGLRLTGGLLLNLRPGHAGATGADVNGQLMSGSGYAGLGYASAGIRGDWSLSADLGLATANIGPGTNAWGLRDMRLQPMVRLGMSLAF